MKVRIGLGLGTTTLVNDGGRFGPFVDELERHGFDSLWLSERLTGSAPDPLVALAFAAARTSKLKLGTSVLVLPGRNPVVLAKELASLDRLSNGRLLPAMGLGAPVPVEHRAFGVARTERAALFDEGLGLMRRLWTEDHVSHHGRHFEVEDVTLLPRPVQEPIEVWLGGQAPSELRRTGRLGDGWLPSFCTVGDVADGWKVITEVAAAHDRSIDREHLGTLVPYCRKEIPEILAKVVASRRPGVEASDVVAVGMDGLVARVRELIDVGASKFVVVPVEEPQDWVEELDELAGRLKPLET